jgi:predicted  nucleic acid-binding Zn-ribbon protein
MLSGCPDCGGNTFQYLPPGVDPPSDPDADPPSRPDSGLAGRAAGAVRDLVGGEGSPAEDTAQAAARADVAHSLDPDEPPDTVGPQDASDEIIEAPPEPPDGSTPESPDSPQSGGSGTPSGTNTAPQGGTTSDTGAADTATGPTPEPAPQTGTDGADIDAVDTPDLDDLREELNDQFESIRIVERGEYELNLMQLYEREEYIVALREDGRYAIDVPETRRTPADE